MAFVRVLIFAKTPEAGRVKTRLAAAVGADAAASLHRRLIEHTLATVHTANVGDIVLWVTPVTDDPFCVALAARYAAALQLQCGGDIGARMAHALEVALSDATPALLIGSDCAALTPDYLRAAAAALNAGHDAVLGPTQDGGYFLIGLRRPCAALFANIEWSTAKVAEQTRVRLREAGVRWYELAPIWDVDEPRDLARLDQLPAFRDWRSLLRSNAIIGGE